MEKIEENNIMTMSELMNTVSEELYKSIGEKYSFWKNNIEFSIVEDDFVFKEEKTYGDHFYMKIDRNTKEVYSISINKNLSLKEINDFCAVVIAILTKYDEDFNRVFGAKLNTIEDFKENVVLLLESGIDKIYHIGKQEIRKNYLGEKVPDFYGIAFNPSSFFDIIFTSRDENYEGCNKNKFYCEFCRNTIDPKSLGVFLISIVEKNKDIINKYIKEGLEEDRDDS